MTLRVAFTSKRALIGLQWRMERKPHKERPSFVVWRVRTWPSDSWRRCSKRTSVWCDHRRTSWLDTLLSRRWCPSYRGSFGSWDEFIDWQHSCNSSWQARSEEGFSQVDPASSDSRTKRSSGAMMSSNAASFQWRPIEEIRNRDIGDCHRGRNLGLFLRSGKQTVVSAVDPCWWCPSTEVPKRPKCCKANGGYIRGHEWSLVMLWQFPWLLSEELPPIGTFQNAFHESLKRHRRHQIVEEVVVDVFFTKTMTQRTGHKRQNSFLRTGSKKSSIHLTHLTSHPATSSCSRQWRGSCEEDILGVPKPLWKHSLRVSTVYLLLIGVDASKVGSGAWSFA